MFPNAEDMKTGGINLVPASLEAFSSVVINSRTDISSDTANRKRTFMNQSIIAATRPRSFISPLQLGLFVHLHRCYGSRHLIDMLHVMCVCSSNKEATNYLNCVVSSPQSTIEPGAFTQFVFDNADVNINDRKITETCPTTKEVLLKLLNLISCCYEVACNNRCKYAPIRTRVLSWKIVK